MVYRDAKPANPHDVKHYHSWWMWRECDVCKREFRREKGFKYFVLQMGYYRTHYMCGNCGCHSQDFVYVNQYIDYMMAKRRHNSLPIDVSKKGPPPIPPPMRP